MLHRNILQRPVELHHLKGLAYWTLFASVLLLGLNLRLYSSQLFGFPFWFPDSGSYTRPALESPLLPLSEARTVGYPATISLAFRLHQHPIAVLYTHNLLWLVSTLALTLSIRHGLGRRWLALVMLCYLCFLHKNFSFEFFLLSEHLSRCLLCCYLAVLLWDFLRPTRLRIVLLAAISFLAIAVKPTAIVLVASTVVYLLLLARLVPERRWRPTAELLGLYLVPVLLLLVAYTGVYRLRFGYFGLSSFTGVALYAHVGYLTNLESDRYPEIMAELRKILPVYHEKYADEHHLMFDWFAYGSLKRECEVRDLGKISPRSIVKDYARTLPGPDSDLRKQERIFFHLAIDAIRANPGEYGKLVLRSAMRMLVEGLSARYPNPNVTVASHKQSIVDWQRLLVELGRPPPAVNGLLYQEDVELSLASLLEIPGRYAVRLTTDTVRRFGWGVLWVVLLAVPVLIVGRRHLSLAPMLAPVGVLAVLLVSYVLLHGMLLAAVPPRYMCPVQDAYCLALLLLAAIEIEAARRLRAGRAAGKACHHPASDDGNQV